MSTNQPDNKASGAADKAAGGGTKPLSAGEVAAAAAAAGSSATAKTGTGPSGVPPWQRGTGKPGERPTPPAAADEKSAPTSALDRTPPAAADAKKAAASVAPVADSAAPAKRPRTLITGTAIPEALRDDPTPVTKPAAAAGTATAATDTMTKESAAASAAGGPRRVGAGADRQGERAPTNGRTPLRASVQIRRIDPWATLKITGVVSVVGFFVWMVAVAVLYLIMDGMGVWGSLNDSLGSVTNADSSGGNTIGAGTVFGIAALIGAVSAVLVTALAAIGSIIYNICADMVGGIEITLADRD